MTVYIRYDDVENEGDLSERVRGELTSRGKIPRGFVPSRRVFGTEGDARAFLDDLYTRYGRGIECVRCTDGGDGCWLVRLEVDA